jgi:hypothetical protein
LELHQFDQLLQILKTRFEIYRYRHQGLDWSAVEAALLTRPGVLATVDAMETSGGQPDVIGQDPKDGAFIFCDCSPETPAGRRSLCYDQQALDARKENKPAGSVVGMAASMGIELLTEAQYRELQKLGEFDLKTSSWVQTPESIRMLGGALFCDRRYGQVFVYHNGAESYYGARGFRGMVKV